MTTGGSAPQFSQPDLAKVLDGLEVAAMDQLDFGVMGFDNDYVVQIYNRMESSFSGFSPERVLGQHVFVTVAPCMNNYLVAQRFEDAWAADEILDVTLDYVFTFRMRPSSVQLRLLAGPGLKRNYVVVRWSRS